MAALFAADAHERGALLVEAEGTVLELLFVVDGRYLSLVHHGYVGDVLEVEVLQGLLLLVGLVLLV